MAVRDRTRADAAIARGANFRGASFMIGNVSIRHRDGAFVMRAMSAIIREVSTF
jgi:hypothetical protein